jgi:hypothetical protein
MLFGSDQDAPIDDGHELVFRPLAGDVNASRDTKE